MSALAGYLALGTVDPVSDTFSEVAFPGYVRQPVAFDRDQVANGGAVGTGGDVLRSTADVVFPFPANADWPAVTAVGVYTASTGGSAQIVLSFPGRGSVHQRLAPRTFRAGVLSFRIKDGGSVESPSGTAKVPSGAGVTLAPGNLSIGGTSFTGALPAPTLASALLPATATFSRSAPAGAIIWRPANKTAGSTISVTPADGRLQIDAQGNVIVGSSPSSVGTISATVTETLAGATNSPVSSPVTFTVTAGVAPAATAPILPVSISGTPASAVVGGSAAFAPTITGGTAPYTLSLLSGSLPPGRAISGVTVVGTYTTAGTYSYTLRATDSAGATADLPISVTVIPDLSSYSFLAGRKGYVRAPMATLKSYASA